MGLVSDPPPRARSTYALVASGDNPLMSSAVTVDAVEPLDEGGELRSYRLSSAYLELCFHAASRYPSRQPALKHMYSMLLLPLPGHS